MSVLMVGVDESTKGGMWTVVENYLNDINFVKNNNLIYIPTSITGCPISNKLLFTAKSYWKIYRIFKKEKICILHVHMSERASIKRKGFVMQYAKRHGVKIVLHMHGAEFEVLYKQMKSQKQKEVREVLDLADKVIILGEYWKDFIGELLSHPEKIEIVYNAVNVPKTYKYDESSNRVLFLGSVSKRKGIHVLLDSLRNIESSISKRCIVNIYGPDADGDIEQEIKKRNLQTWVKYCGWLDKDSKGNILEHTMLNVLPSFNEGLPMTLLEAMSYGVPSITTNVAAIPEAIDYTNGVIVNPGNIDELSLALEKMILDDDMRKKLSKKSYQDAVERFSVEKHISIIQRIYEELKWSN